MSKDIKKLAVLIGDICGSTALYENIGDNPARQIIEKGIATMIGPVSTYQGTLINAVGDQILCTFPSPEKALLAACSMQSAVRNFKFENDYRLQIRIGLHYGNVILQDDAAYGDAINVTSRVAAIANASQIMTTQAIYSALPPSLKEQTIPFLKAGLRGKLTTYDIYFVHWENDDVSSVTRFNVPNPLKEPVKTDELTLFYCGKTLKVNNHRKIVTIGRESKSDIVISNPYASRQHLHCELRAYKIYIVDHSINGTYIRFNENKVVHLLHEELNLQGSGAISLGHNNFDSPNNFIEFVIAIVR